LLFKITDRHANVGERVKAYAEQKTSKLPRYYNSINQVEVIIDGSRLPETTVEVIARAEHGRVFVASETGEDVLGCIDSAVHKLESQLRKAKGKERENKHAGGAEPM